MTPIASMTRPQPRNAERSSGGECSSSTPPGPDVEEYGAGFGSRHLSISIFRLRICEAATSGRKGGHAQAWPPWPASLRQGLRPPGHHGFRRAVVAPTQREQSMKRRGPDQGQVLSDTSHGTVLTPINSLQWTEKSLLLTLIFIHSIISSEVCSIDRVYFWEKVTKIDSINMHFLPENADR